MRELYVYTPLILRGGESGTKPLHFEIELAPAQITQAMIIILVSGIK